LELPKRNFITESKEIDSTRVYSQWHTVTLSFDGPETSESAEDNPFLNYKLNVSFQNTDNQYEITGYYAADGNASQSSALSGNGWQEKFTPDLPCKWSYQAVLYNVDRVAISEKPNPALAVPTGTRALDEK
jgi:hypothetical protein